MAINRRVAFGAFTLGFVTASMGAVLLHLILPEARHVWPPEIGWALVAGPFLIFALLLLAFGAAMMLIAGRLLIIDQPGLIVDEKGILDNTQFVPFGRVDWEDVNRILLRQAPHRPYSRYPDVSIVSVFVHHPRKYLKRIGVIGRLLRRRDFTYALIVIPDYLLEDWAETVGGELIERHRQFQRLDSREEPDWPSFRPAGWK